MTAGTKWVTAIGVLLGGNVIAMVVLALVANIGHSEVIPEYYDQAVHYDDALDQGARNHALGWHAELSIVAGQLEVTLRDGRGALLAGAAVSAAGYPRAHASERIMRALTPTGPGRYRGVFDDQLGVHDVTLTVERGHDRYTQQLAVEAR